MRAESWAARRRRMNVELATEIRCAWNAMQATRRQNRTIIEQYVALRYLQARRD